MSGFSKFRENYVYTGAKVYFILCVSFSKVSNANQYFTVVCYSQIIIFSIVFEFFQFDLYTLVATTVFRTVFFVQFSIKFEVVSLFPVGVLARHCRMNRKKKYYPERNVCLRVQKTSYESSMDARVLYQCV